MPYIVYRLTGYKWCADITMAYMSELLLLLFVCWGWGGGGCVGGLFMPSFEAIYGTETAQELKKNYVPPPPSPSFSDSLCFHKTHFRDVIKFYSWSNT